MRVNVKPYEASTQIDRPLSEATAQTLATLFNEHITLIIDSSVRTFGQGELNGLLLTSTGAQIDGSWRNSIGDEAEKVVQRLLVKEVLDRGLLRALLPRPSGPPVPLDGAAKKSFAQTPAATTILVASRITPEVDHRIRQDPAINHYFNLTAILSEKAIYETFAHEVYALLGAMP